MISLALSSSKLGSSPETRETAANGEAKGANGAFSGVLAALTDQFTAIDAEIAPAADPELPAASGIALPVPAESGKILPDIAAGKLAAPTNGEAHEGGEAEDETEIAEAAPVAPPVQLPMLAALPEPAVPAEAKPTQPSTASSAATVFEGAPLPLPLPAAMPKPAKTEGGERAETPSVSIHVAPEADADAAPREPKAVTEFQPAKTGAELQPAKAREVTAEGPMPKAASAEAAPAQSQPTSFAATLPGQAPQAGKTFEAARPSLHAEALQDLTRVVDRLAAAREAFAPAAAALAVKHADFGDISLRFDQQRDGQLAVQLSASDPEAHRAIVAAVNDRGAATADSQTGSSQSQAQANTRGAAAEREGGSASNGNATRQDQPQQRRAAAQQGQTGTGAQRAGIFA